ncbi:MAG: (2Fe-2S)-binding protein [Pseudoxanthomonas sp.]
MYVCVCNGVTDRQVLEAAANGCRSTSELTMRTGCGATCGTCLDMAAEMLDEFHARREFPLPLVACAA